MQIRPTASASGLIINFSIALFHVYTEFGIDSLANGVKAVNIPEILVDYRTTPDNYNRRRNWKNTKSFLKVRWDNYKNGYCSFLDFLIPGIMQIFMFLMPVKFTETIYRYILRK
jgi:hypothetical protein